MLKQLKKMRNTSDQKGFTIIEVLIVLAIAGLIMVVVFLAVPALQRSGRNNALNTDANNILTAVGNYVSDNGGAIPTTIATFTVGDGKVTIGASTSDQSVATVDSGINSVTLNPATPLTAATVTASTVKPGDIQVITGSTAVCNATKTGLGTTTGSPRNYVVLYVAENANGNILKCIGA